MKIGERREELVARLRLLHGLLAGVLAVIASTYWFVQVVQGPDYRELADNNRLRKLPLVAPRGLVYDRHGQLLVENVPSYNLLLDRGRSLDLDTSLRFASGILALPVSELAVVLGRSPGEGKFGPALVAENLSLAEVARFSVAALEHPEFEVETRALRLYRHGAQTAHLLGYLGEVGEADLGRADHSYKAGDLIGKKGIEKNYDERLRGTDGEQVVVVESRGRTVAEYARASAVSGQSLRLTLDLGLQQEAERLMADRVGAVVALDPTNGEVLALVSSPSYDPNLFSRRLASSEWQGLLDAAHHPLQNRALQNTHSPGSVFKAVMATAGLSEAVVGEHDRVFCSGSTTLYNRRFRCWKPGGHGWVDLRQALKVSCDVYFYHLGQKLGIERIAEYARRFGFGHLAGIDLEGEKAGLVPDTAWSQRARRHPWYPGETISVAIGQGPLLVTPLQMATMMAAVANGGLAVTPHLVAGGPGVAPPRRLGLDSRALAVVREALWMVVNEQGTGAAAYLPGRDIAGKTGTTQVIAQKTWTDSADLAPEHRDHAWFASFAPAEQARLVVVVFVEHGGKGSQAAAPVAKALYEKFFGHDQPRQPAS